MPISLSEININLCRVDTIKAVLHYPTISHNFFSTVAGTSMYKQFLTMSVKVTVADERPSS